MISTGTTEVTVTVQSVVRLTNTPSGNPRWRVFLTNGASYVTDDDSACVYSIGAHLNGRTVTLRLRGSLAKIIGLEVSR